MGDSNIHPKVGAWGVGKKLIIIIFPLFIIYILDKYHIDSGHGIYYNERVHNIANSFIENAIDKDKKTRIYWMKKEGYDSKKIDEIILSLEGRYAKEKLKIYDYCKLDSFGILDYFTGFIYDSEYCSISHDWTDKNGADFTYFRYIFDKESSELFNSIKLIYHKDKLSLKKVKNVEWYEEYRVGFTERRLFLNRKNVSVGAIDFDYEMIPFVGDIDKVDKNKIWRKKDENNS